jgi:hypothetical protein
MNAPLQPLKVDTFAFRTERCPECGGSGMRSNGGDYYSWREIECFDCGGEGEWTASCAECCGDKPLNGDGLCAECAGLVEVEYLKTGGILA